MTLYIKNPDGLPLEEFISLVLIPSIQRTFIDAIDNKRLYLIEKYINSLKISENNKYIDLRSILISAIYNLVYKRTLDGNYIITIDATQKAVDISAKIIDIAHMVNYGTLSTPAYPIFDDVFSYFSDKLRDLYIGYCQGEFN